MSTKTAAMTVAIIISAYRSNFPHGDETFAQIATRALEDYPDQVLQALACPKRGIIATSKFAPAISELRAWCDEKHAELRAEAMRNAPRLEQTTAEKEAIEERRKRAAHLLDVMRRAFAKPERGDRRFTVEDVYFAIRNDIEVPEWAIKDVGEDNLWEFRWSGYGDHVIQTICEKYLSVLEYARNARELRAQARVEMMGPNFFDPIK